MLNVLKQIQALLQLSHAADLHELKKSIPLEERSLTHSESDSDAEINSKLEITEHNIHLCSFILNDIMANAKPGKALTSDVIELLTELGKQIRSVLDFLAHYAEKTIGYGTFHAPTPRYALAQPLLTETSELQRVFLEFQATVHGYTPSSLPQPGK